MPTAELARAQFTTYGPFEGFQGAVFAQPVFVPPSTPFLVVLSGGTRGLALTQSGFPVVPLFWRFAQGPWFQRGFVGELSIRIYEGYHPGTATYYGTGRPGSQSVTPWLSHRGFPNTANKVALDVTQVPSNLPCVFLLGIRTQITLPIATIYAQPVDSIATTTAGGWATIQLAIPYSTSLAGVPLATQAALLDPGAAAGLSHTQGVELLIGH
ncbi:MAG: hypothetical protein IPM29_23950 [Planctomycetes bacterium]|nr:hypothetical protein [Planctomycetota bacterium]